jgi:hypothetical protein
MLDSEDDVANRGVGAVRGRTKKESSASEASEALADVDLCTRFGGARVTWLEAEEGFEVGTESAPAVCGRLGRP